MYITISVKWENGEIFDKIVHGDMAQEDLVQELLYIISKYKNYSLGYINPDGEPALHVANLIRCRMEENGREYTFGILLHKIYKDTIHYDVEHQVREGFKELKESNMEILHTGDGHTLYARANPTTAEAVRLAMDYSGFDPFRIIAGEMPTPKIKKVIISYPATIVFFDDKTKIVVKCQEDDVFDPEKGIAIAVMRKLYPKKYGDILSMKDKKITYVTEHDHHIETCKPKTKKK